MTINTFSIKKYLLFSFFLGVVFNIKADQGAIIDSLKRVINSDVHDTTKIKAYASWDNLIYNSDPNLDLELNTNIIKLCSSNLENDLTETEKNFYLKFQARTYNNLGIIFKNRGDFETAINYYFKSLSIKTKLNDNKGIANAYRNIGLIFHIQGNLVKALDEYYASLKIFESIQDTAGIIGVKNNIGAVYHYQDNYTHALIQYYQCLELGKVYSKGYQLQNTYGNIGFVYFEQGDSALLANNPELGKKLIYKSLDFYKEALEISKVSNDILAISRTLNNIGSSYHKLDEKDIALDYFNESLRLKNEIHDLQGEASVLTNIGSIYFGKKQYFKAIKFGGQAYLKARESEAILEINTSSELLYNSYKETNNFDKALEYLEVYMNTRDSIVSKENSTSTIQQQFEYEYDKKTTADSIIQAEALKVKNAEIAVEKAESERQKLEASSQRKQKYYLYGGLILVALFGVFMLNRFQVTRRQKNIIDKQKSEVESQKAQIVEQHMELEASHKEINDSIKYAERLQLAILPSRENLKSSLKDGFVLFLPKDVVSGDFYWMQSLNGLVLFAAADCTGHGVPGAMVSVVCSNALNRCVKEFKLSKPNEILNKTRELVIETFSRSGEDVKDGMDIALCSLQLSSNRKHLEFAGANNPMWIVRNTDLLSLEEQKDENITHFGNRSLIEYKSDKQPVGLFIEQKPFGLQSLDLQKGDIIYIFTDGYADQFGGERGKKFKYKPFKRLILSLQDKDMDTQKSIIEQEFHKWKGDFEQVDDVCVIGVRV